MQKNTEISQGNEHDMESRGTRVQLIITDEYTVSKMLSVLGVHEQEEDPFLDAFFAVFFQDGIVASDYALLKKYLGNKQFIENFNQISSESRKTLIQAGYTPQDIDMIGQDIQTSIEVILKKFQIFDVLGNPELIGEKYVTHCKSSMGDILLSRDGKEIYLLRVGTIYSVEDCFMDIGGELNFMIFNTGDSLIVFDYKTKNMYQVPGAFVTWIDKPGLQAFITLTDTEELCFIPQTAQLVRKKRIITELKPDFYTFQNVHFIGEDADEICLQHVGWDVSVRQDENAGGFKVSQRVIEKLSRLDNGEEIFADAAEIKEVISTSQDTYVVVEKELSSLSFDSDILPQDFFQGVPHNNMDFTEKVSAIYSVREGHYLPAIPAGGKFRLIQTDDNLIVLSVDKYYEYFYSCKDDMGFPGIKIDGVQEFYIDGIKKVIIDYTDQYGQTVSYDSTCSVKIIIDDNDEEHIFARTKMH